MRSRVSGTRGLVAVLLGAALLSSACGLKPEARDSLGLAQGGTAVDAAAGGAVDAGTGVVEPGLDADAGVVDPGAGAADPGAVDPAAGAVDPGTTAADPGGGAVATDPGAGGAAADPGAPAGGGGGGGGGGGSTGTADPGTAPEAPTTGGTEQAPAGASEEPVKGTTTGLTASTITLGFHAPLTGAAPVPQTSFESGSKIFWRDHKLAGREVKIVLRDDKYTPSGAVKACRELARSSFLVLGAAGTDQIQACGKDSGLRRASTPYLSAGVTTNGLEGIETYFATSMTYEDQGPVLVRAAADLGYLRSTGPTGNKKWAVVLSNTPNFADARRGIETALKSAGVPFDSLSVPKAGSDQDAVTLSNKLRQEQYPVVYFLGQPTFFLKVVGATQNATYRPTWTGVGVSMGLNSIHKVACESTRASGGYNAFFLSPYPGLDRAPKGIKFKDDIELSLYGSSEQLFQIFANVSGPLTRERFIKALDAGAKTPGGVFPPLDFSKRHFGGKSMYMLKSNCAKGEQVTVGGLRS